VFTVSPCVLARDECFVMSVCKAKMGCGTTSVAATAAPPIKTLRRDTGSWTLGSVAVSSGLCSVLAIVSDMIFLFSGELSDGPDDYKQCNADRYNIFATAEGISRPNAFEARTSSFTTADAIDNA
jgi:hypothetical protein